MKEKIEILIPMFTEIGLDLLGKQLLIEMQEKQELTEWDKRFIDEMWSVKIMEGGLKV